MSEKDWQAEHNVDSFCEEFASNLLPKYELRLVNANREISLEQAKQILWRSLKAYMMDDGVPDYGGLK